MRVPTFDDGRLREGEYFERQTDRQSERNLKRVRQTDRKLAGWLLNVPATSLEGVRQTDRQTDRRTDRERDRDRDRAYWFLNVLATCSERIRQTGRQADGDKQTEFIDC